MRPLMTMAAAILMGLALIGCVSEADPPVPATDAAARTPAPDEEPAAGDSELAGTEWRLVKIAEMNDTTHVPDDSAKYTLALGADGGATIQADCNRGTGTWGSTGKGNLHFGPIAATRALCPPESISEVYLKQFQWIVSYVMSDGHLFLATMADGSIIEFEPFD
jgi:heat shock protein HslJ